MQSAADTNNGGTPRPEAEATGQSAADVDRYGMTRSDAEMVMDFATALNTTYAKAFAAMAGAAEAALEALAKLAESVQPDEKMRRAIALEAGSIRAQMRRKTLREASRKWGRRGKKP